MRIFTYWPQHVGLMLSKPSYVKNGGFACQWLGNVEMHMYAKCDHNIRSDSRVINIFTNC